MPLVDISKPTRVRVALETLPYHRSFRTMNLELLDFVERLGTAETAEVAGAALVDVMQQAGASIVHSFMGTPLDSFRATNIPDWALQYEYHLPGLLNAHSVQAVRSGAPKIFWGTDLDADNPLATQPGRLIAENRREHFGCRTNLNFSMPDPDGQYRGGGVGIGFEDDGEAFLTRMEESCGTLALVCFAAHSRMQVLHSRDLPASPLSRRQTEVLQFLAAGYHLSGISDKLGISDSTVNLHLSQLKKKLRVKTKEQALAMALTNGWIQA